MNFSLQLKHTSFSRRIASSLAERRLKGMEGEGCLVGLGSRGVGETSGGGCGPSGLVVS